MTELETKAIRLVAADLDGTLLNSRGQVSAYSRRILAEIRANGIKVVISSGRPLQSVREIVPDTIYDYLSCLNGQYILRPADGWQLEQPKLHAAEICRMFQLVQQQPIIMNLIDDSCNITACARRYVPFAIIFSLIQKMRWISKQIPSAHRRLITRQSDLTVDSIAKVCFCGSSRSLRQLQKQLLAEGFGCVFVGPQWLEAQPYGVSKGAALQRILAEEQIPASQAVSFGDGENDVSLLQACGTSVAMANAMPQAKEAADAITLDHDRDGVAIWLQDNILAKRSA